MGAQCTACQEQGQPEHFASPVKCAFPDGVFTADNWQCATLTKLRGHLIDRGLATWQDDSYCVLEVCHGEDGGFLMLSWYKSRGCTSSVLWVCEDEHRLATLAEVEATLAAQPREAPRA